MTLLWQPRQGGDGAAGRRSSPVKEALSIPATLFEHERRRSLDVSGLRLWEAASSSDRLRVGAAELAEPKEDEMAARAIPEPHTSVFLPERVQRQEG
jgi:hypothetical protein